MNDRLKRFLRLVAVPLADAAILLRQGLRRCLGRADTQAPGRFFSSEFSHAGLKRQYKVYVPPGVAQGSGKPLPLIVMLHGCGQHPDDFAAGTGMNELAKRHQFYVLYPAQPKEANALRCWNWFKHNHQQRDRGEPALIAGLTREVMQTHAIDPARVFVAGLSAGGAMAAILAAEYPELYAALGVHSGLAPGIASNAMEAMGVMKGGAAGGAISALAWFTGPRTPKRLSVPTIVFHGDQDKTVHPRNGEQLMQARLAGHAVADVPLPALSQELGRSSRGRRFTRSLYRDGVGRLVGEHWLLHGAGHAWSGGHPKASYTDARGPDASRLMLHFFLGTGQPPSLAPVTRSGSRGSWLPWLRSQKAW